MSSATSQAKWEWNSAHSHLPVSLPVTATTSQLLNGKGCMEDVIGIDGQFDLFELHVLSL